VSPNSELCGAGGECDVVKDSVYARPLGIPTPAIGVVYFAALLALVAVRRTWARSMLVVASIGGALGALGFLALQAFVLKAWCKFCVVTDVAALIVCALAIAGRRARARPPGAQGWLLLGAVTAAAYLAPFGLAALERRGHAEHVVAGELPASIAREQRPGVATVVEFLDFECPYCRKLHARLEPILAEYGDRVRVVRKMTPLAMHVHAEQAARAWCCAEDVGKGEEMADALMRAESLDVGSCERIAGQLELDLPTYRECLTDARTSERLRADKDEAISIGVHALPTFFIGRERFTGLAEEGEIRDSITRALADARQGS
jgi:protein-disulfide isomerase/uncharacterized membrane protein